MNTINKITVSGNTYGIVDTDTKVTSAANHYTPSADNNAELTASLSGTAGAYAKDTEYTVLTGVKAQRDAKGHVTGLTYTAQKVKDTDTTYSITTGSSNGTISVNGTNVSVKGLGNMAYKSSLSADDIPSITKSKISDFPSSMPASDVSAWAKASTKPTYIASEVMSISAVAISANTSSSCSITGSGNAGKAQTIIYTNSGSTDYTVTVPTTYSTPDGAAIELTCKAGGYCEVSYLNISGTIYARGL